MKIGYILKWDKNQQSIANITLQNHKDYCDKHEYTLIVDTGVWDQSRNGMWMKHVAIMRALRNNDYNDIDWFFWSDIDVLIMNQTITLESILQQCDYDKYNIIASKWAPDTGFPFFNQLSSKFVQKLAMTSKFFFTIHTGNFFIKNNSNSYKLIHSIYTDRRFRQKDISDYQTGDEIGFVIYYLAYPDIRKQIYFLPIEQLHIVPSEDKLNTFKHYECGDFLVHANYRSIEEKVNILKKYYDNYSSTI